jgi:hypothetical protein
MLTKNCVFCNQISTNKNCLKIMNFQFNVNHLHGDMACSPLINVAALHTCTGVLYMQYWLAQTIRAMLFPVF